tara:strand:- start:140 stop:799 length:660 start_codon:yes stop_codon:yes gene_type:complete
MDRPVFSSYVLALLGVGFAQVSLAADIVAAIKVMKPLVLSAGAADPTWETPKALTVPVAGGENFKDGKTSASIISGYSDEMLYMLVQYDDPTRSIRRLPWQKQADGSWEKLRDPNDEGGGGYTNIELANGKDSKLKPGDEVASIMIAPFTGDRGDIAAAMNWKNDKWTVVMSRKLVTGSNYDVQFDNLSNTFEFGLAAFDNAQVRHAFHVGPFKPQFRN